ncbi:16347_t:CDS:2, partial [Dentiscutata heterogama]
MSTNLSHDLLLHRNQDELQEFLTDVQTLDNEGDYDDDPLFNFEQNLYGQALDLTEHEDDPWKELNAEDVPDISYEEIEEIEEVSSEYSEEIPATTQKPTTLCVIIDNDYGEIRRCNRISNKRLQELVGVWEIDANAVEELASYLRAILRAANVVAYSKDYELIIEHPMEFGMSEINFALKEAVGKGCKVPPPNVVILEAGPAPSTNLAAHKACEMYIEDLELNQGESLDIASDIENGNNNILKVWTLYYKWASYLKLHKIGIRMGNFEVQHEHLKAFAPLFPITGKSRYAVSVPRFLMTVETNPTLKAKLQIVGSVNLTADEYFFAYDEALECFGVKFVKQNMTGRPTDLDNLKLVIKAAQNERDRLLALHAEFVTDNCI